MTNIDRRLAAIATGQLGAFSRTQATNIGLSDRQLRSRVQSGILEQTGPNAFRFPGTQRSIKTELIDTLLDIGGDVWCAGPTAAALWGFDGFRLRRPFHLLVPRRRSLNRWNVRVHRTDSIGLVDQSRVGEFPVTSPARTLVDLSRTLPAAALSTCLDSAIRDGLVSEDALHRRIVELRSKGRYGLPLLDEVLAGFEVTRGGHSWLEREFLRLLDQHHVVRPAVQQVLSKEGDRLIRVDCHFVGTPVVVELLGYRFHRTKAQMSNDATRYNALLAQGSQPYQFTYRQVVLEPDYVVDTTIGALERAVA